MDSQSAPSPFSNADIWPPAPLTEPGMRPQQPSGWRCARFFRRPQLRHNLSIGLVLLVMALYQYWKPDIWDLSFGKMGTLSELREDAIVMTLLYLALFSSLVQIGFGAFTRRGWSVVSGLVHLCLNLTSIKHRGLFLDMCQIERHC